MTTPVYVRSTDGDNADNGTTWALAKATLVGSLDVDEAGGTVYVSDNHAESTASAITLSFAGTNAAPMKILCVDDAAEPPTALATTGTVTTTGASGIQINGNVYVYGITFLAGSGAVVATISFDQLGASLRPEFEKCAFKLVATGTGSSITLGLAGNYHPSLFKWKNCDVSFAAQQKMNLPMGEFIWEGGSILSGSTALTGAMLHPSSAGEYAKATITGVDFQHLGSGSYLVACNVNGTCDIVFRNCRLPSSWTGGLVTGTIQPRDRVSMYNCDSADTNYNLWIEEYCGQIIDSTTIYNDAGADDGSAQGFSWKMTASANAEYPHMALRSDEIVKWNETTGSAITATVEIVHDSQGSGANGVLNDDEIWLEVLYLGTSGVPLGSWMTDAKGGGTANVFTNVLATAAAQTTSAASWTGDSSGWDTQKLSVTFTPQEKGFIHARVALAKASAVVYVDPLVTIAAA